MKVQAVGLFWFRDAIRIMSSKIFLLMLMCSPTVTPSGNTTLKN